MKVENQKKGKYIFYTNSNYLNFYIYTSNAYYA